MSRGIGLRQLAVLLALVLACAAPAPRGPAGEPPILILVSFDGWRWDYVERQPAPNLRALAARGVRATAMIPSFPVLTFPNHYTIATGLYPEHHGIVGNNIRAASMPDRFTMSSATARDGRWWGGEPVWVSAIRQGLRAATLFWPGTEAMIDGVRPTYWKPFDNNLGTLERVDQVLAWLALPAAEQPSFVSLYFEEVDTAGHDFGPDSPELAAAAAHLDRALGALVAGVHRLGLDDRTTLVVVSDHGMTPTSYDRVIYLDSLIDMSTVDVLEYGSTLQLNPLDGDVVGLYRRLYGKHPKLAIYKRQDVPKRLHFSDNDRIPAIVGIPADGWSATTGQRLVTEELHVGAHGYEPTTADMGALFVAAGPSLRPGLVVKPFENVHVYDLLCRILRITPAHNDGRPAVTRGFMR
ncbi:MAG TPA: ectonucleotide pyrophosphatase/phosphodiesterase [Vicinamibacterales bacterium]|nr:ectonucleotide pyrophosphatase/phosphodiesterase [Vicinamibacterales bacterium]